MGMIHGLQANEMFDLQSALSDAEKKTCHPLLVPSLLCQLLVDSDANSVRKHAANLYHVEFKTNYHGFSTPKAMVYEVKDTHGWRIYPTNGCMYHPDLQKLLNIC